MRKIPATLSLLSLVITSAAYAGTINEIDSLFGQSLNNYNWTQANKEQIDSQKQSITKLEKETGQLNKKEERDFIRSNNYSKTIDAKTERNTQGVIDNRIAMNNNSNDIQEIRKSMENMSQHLYSVEAMNMATSNLFQPYGVGKMNVSVGLGAYHDAHAVAIGSGVRLDEHFAVRSSVSFEDSTSHAAVGVGASYEW
jgi:autotransporter adhesin